MEQVKMYCVIYRNEDKKDNSIYVCARDISEACAMGNKYLEDHEYPKNNIKQIQECKIKPYVDFDNIKIIKI